MALHFAGNCLRYLTPHQSVCTLLSNSLKHQRQLRVTQHMARWPGLSISIIKIGCCHWVFAQVSVRGH